MPFTSNPSHRVEGPSQTARAASATVREIGSLDSRMHSDPRIKRHCPECDSMPGERCAAARYPSGRVQRFAADFHEGR